MERTICVFGASITWGAYDSEKGGWVNRLRLDLEKRDEDYISVYNLGVDGNTTSDLLERFEVEAKAREPDILIFSIGDNDSALISLDKFEQNLTKLIKLAKKFTKNIIFLGFKLIDESKTNPVPWDKSISYTNEKLSKYHSKLKEVVNKENLMIIEVEDLLDVKKDLGDGLHPNDEGHNKLFLKVKEFLQDNELI